MISGFRRDVNEIWGLFWNFKQRIMVIPYGRFGITCLFHLRGSSSLSLDFLTVEGGTETVLRCVKSQEGADLILE
jgi:hypothetical protein